MLQLVNVGHKSLADYASLAARGLMEEIRRLAEPLAGKRVAHVSATAFGGGVAEINYTLVPLMQSAGLEVEWRIIRGQEDFFNVTKTIHNALQGNPQGLTDDDRAVFDHYQRLNASEFDAGDYDFVVMHDPQPVGMIDHRNGSSGRWIWSTIPPTRPATVGRAFQSASLTVRPNPSRIDFWITAAAWTWNAFTSTEPTLFRFERM